MSEQQDTWDVMRSRSWDPLPEGDTIEGLIAALGLADKDLREVAHGLKRWEDSPAAQPAPAELKKPVHQFLEAMGLG